MSVASSSQRAFQQQVWADLRRDLFFAGVPNEAHPRQLPLCYESYAVYGPQPERNVINVLPRVRRFLIPSQVTGGAHCTIITWGNDVAHAWREAKRLALW